MIMRMWADEAAVVPDHFRKADLLAQSSWGETTTDPTQPWRRPRGRSVQGDPWRGSRSDGLGERAGLGHRCRFGWNCGRDRPEVETEAGGRLAAHRRLPRGEGGQLPAALDFGPMGGAGGADPAGQTGDAAVVQGRG